MSEYAGNQSEGSFGYSEATATWSVRYIYNGFECILSIQAETGAEALRKAESALTHLTEAKCLPYHRDSQNANGQGNGHKPGATVVIKNKGEAKMCPIHNVPMTQWSKNKKTWFAHRWDNGWCQGKKS